MKKTKLLALVMAGVLSAGMLTACGSTAESGSASENTDETTFVTEFHLSDYLDEEGFVKETESGAVFVKNYLFTSQKTNYTALSVSAGVLLCGNRNGWEYWKDENGHSLNENKELKKRVTGK